MRFMLIGGPYSFGENIVKKFNADCYSRSTGYDINNKDSVEKIITHSLNYDIVIIHAYTGNDSQLCFTQKLVDKWIENNHSGHIIVTSSISTYYKSYKENAKNWIYTAHKSALDSFCKSVSKKSCEGSLPFKISIIKPGMMDTENSRKKSHFIKGINGEEFCKCIDFIINMPKDVLIPELIIESIFKN